MSTQSRPTQSRGPVYLLLFATLVAAAGNGISIVAYPWLVLQRNGSALEASIVAGAASLPLLFSTLLAGAAVDFLGRKRISIISDILSGGTVAAVPLIALVFGVSAVNVATCWRSKPGFTARNCSNVRARRIAAVRRNVHKPI